MVGTGFNETGVREQLEEKRHEEDDKEGQDVHVRFASGPVLEENISVFAPEEGHVHHHLPVHHHAHGAVCGWRRRRHPSHAVHVFIHGYRLGFGIDL